MTTTIVTDATAHAAPDTTAVKHAPAIQPDWPHLYEDVVFYPDKDGVPLPDGEYQGPMLQEVVPTLRAHFADRPDVRVNGNTFIYYERGNPRRFVSPDCYVAFGVSVDTILYHNTYRIWAIGKPPDFVLEIASPSTARHDVGAKRALYARIGMGEYWRYDGSADSQYYGERLVGERLVNGAYQRLPVTPDADGNLRGHSPALGLDLVWGHGRLRFYDPAAGVWLRNYDEERAARAVAELEVQELREQLRQLQANSAA